MILILCLVSVCCYSSLFCCSHNHTKEMENALELLSAVQQDALRRCHDRVEAFAKSQMASLGHMEMDIPGVSRNPESMLMNLSYILIRKHMTIL